MKRAIFCVFVSILTGCHRGEFGIQTQSGVAIRQTTASESPAPEAPSPTPTPSPDVFEMCVEPPPTTKCDLFNRTCNINIAASIGDTLGQLLPANCGLEAAVGGVFSIAGWDPNAPAEQNLLNIETDLVCQVLECFPPTDPATISLKCGCAAFSWARTGLTCWQLQSECEIERAAQPPTLSCRVDEWRLAVNPCDAKNDELDDETIQSHCGSRVEYYLPQEGREDGEYGNCLATCVSSTIEARDGGMCAERRNRPRPTSTPAPTPVPFPQIILVDHIPEELRVR